MGRSTDKISARTLVVALFLALGILGGCSAAKETAKPTPTFDEVLKEHEAGFNPSEYDPEPGGKEAVSDQTPPVCQIRRRSNPPRQRRWSWSPASGSSWLPQQALMRRPRGKPKRKGSSRENGSTSSLIRPRTKCGQEISKTGSMRIALQSLPRAGGFRMPGRFLGGSSSIPPLIHAHQGRPKRQSEPARALTSSTFTSGESLPPRLPTGHELSPSLDRRQSAQPV